MIEWTTEMQVHLLQAMSTGRLVGWHKHFHMIQVLRQFNQRTGLQLTAKQLWQYVGTLWNLPLLDSLDEFEGQEHEFDSSTFFHALHYGSPATDSEFTLFPPEEFHPMVEQRVEQRKQSVLESDGELSDVSDEEDENQDARSESSTTPSRTKNSKNKKLTSGPSSIPKRMRKQAKRPSSSRDSSPTGSATKRSRETSPVVVSTTVTSTNVSPSASVRSKRAVSINLAAAAEETPVRRRNQAKEPTSTTRGSKIPKEEETVTPKPSSTRKRR